MSSRKYLLGFVAVAMVGLVAGGVHVMAQDAPKPAGQQKPGAAAGARGGMAEKLAERQEKTMKLMEASKTTLAQAITAAETTTKGKAFQANMFPTNEGALAIRIGLFVNGKVVHASVDPATGKATVNEGPEKEKEGEGGGG